MSKGTILVIDDERQIRMMLTRMLEREDYSVLVSENGDEGLQACRNQCIDLIITDIVMPEKEGIETIRELREYFPEVKIIAISGGGRIGPDSYLSLAEYLGAHYTFTKPLTRKDLLAAVEDLLGEDSCP